MLFTEPNGNSLFLPHAGYLIIGHIAANLGLYWSSSLDTSHQVYAWHFNIYDEFIDKRSSDRGEGGLSVRAVREN